MTAERKEMGADETGALVERARAGSLTAFESLYRAHSGAVFALCLRMVGDRARAEELAQEAFVRAWQRLESFRGDSAFTSWLHRLTVNVVLGDRRSQIRRQGREAPLERSSTARRPAAVGAAVDLERAISALPPRARAVFVLFEIHGYRHPEVAEMLGISVGASKAQLSRARSLLREVLE